MEVIGKATEQRRLTVLLVTHNPEIAERGERRLRLTDGIVTE
jgi:ABC-type lipoprotein export system ATPase subunit